MICGVEGGFHSHLHYVRDIIGLAEGAHSFAAVAAIILPSGTYFVADTYVKEYYQKADVWPLAPEGEILVILMIEDTAGIESLSDILKNVPGIGAVLIGEGDLSQELGYPRQYEHPMVLEAMAEIVNTCKENNVAVGHPHVNAGNVQRVLDQGYTFLMAAPVRSTPGLDKGLELAGRSAGEKPSGPAPSY